MELLRQAKLAEEGAPKIDMKPKGFLPNYFADDPASNNSGIYELKVCMRISSRLSKFLFRH